MASTNGSTLAAFSRRRFLAGAAGLLGAADEQSPAGRTRTAPAADASPEALRFAFASCQQFEHGYYTAYRHMAEEDLDLVVHLGDYIYEHATDAYQAPGGNVRHHVGPETATLEGYRQRYAQYRTDPDLQAAHAAFPWVVTWDDHEVDNNYAGDIAEDNEPPAAFRARRAAAYQAYWEHMPLPAGWAGQGADLRIYRRLAFGRLAELNVLDTRLNPVVLTGDFHSNWVADLKADFNDPKSATVGTEFVGTSISSGGDGSDTTLIGQTALAENGHLRFSNSQRGYIRCAVTPTRWTADYRVVPYVRRPDGPVSTRASFVVEPGRPGANPG